MGALWTATGTLLGSATFVTETATGWQQQNVVTPIPVAAGTVYVGSYRAPNGGYAADTGYFSGRAVERGPMRLLQDGESGGTDAQFPSNHYQASNYWVDFVFEPAP